MTAPAHDESTQPDQLEEATKYIPWVIPLAGGIMIFLLAFIAVTMA